jgi:hypothetical protein
MIASLILRRKESVKNENKLLVVIMPEGVL